MTELILFLWVIGWLYAAGKADWSKEKVKKHDPEWLKPRNVGRPVTYLVLFLLWPHYLGYGE